MPRTAPREDTGFASPSSHPGEGDKQTAARPCSKEGYGSAETYRPRNPAAAARLGQARRGRGDGDSKCSRWTARGPGSNGPTALAGQRSLREVQARRGASGPKARSRQARATRCVRRDAAPEEATGQVTARRGEFAAA